MNNKFFTLILIAFIVTFFNWNEYKISSMYLIKDDRTKPDFTLPSIETAIWREDNDFVTFEDNETKFEKVLIPEEVKNKIHDIAKKNYQFYIKNMEQENEKWYYKLKEFYGPIFMIKAPQGKQLYVYKVILPFSASNYYFILYELETKVATENPPYIYGKWMEGKEQNIGMVPRYLYLEKPLVTFDDINLDGKQEIVIQEMVHNGTVYNGVIYHYFTIENNLSLNRILALETRIYILDKKGDEVVFRTLEKLSPNQIKLKVIIRDLKDSAKYKDIGEVILKSKDASSPFEIVKKNVKIKEYEWMMITYSEKDENLFLKEGLGFYY